MKTGNADQFKGMTRSGDDIDEVAQSPNLDPTNGDGSNPREPQMMGGEDQEQLLKSDCLRYANTIKETLTDDKYTEFLRIMRQFRKNRIDFFGVKEKVVELFAGHPELLITFNNYLPKELEVNLTQEDELREYKKPIQDEVAMNFVNNMKMGLQDNYDIYTSFLEILNSYRMGKRSVFQVHQEVADLLRDHEDLHMEFTNLFPDYHNAHNQHKQHGSTYKSYVRSLEDIVLNLFPTDMHDRVACLCKTVREQVRDSDDYLRFLKCIKHYQTENIDRQQLQSLVHDLLQEHPNLKKEFSEVLNHSDKTEDGNVEHNENKVEIGQEISEKGKRKRSATSSRPTVEKGKKKRSRVSKKDNNKVKPLRELDLSNCESCTPSYRLVPKNYPIPATTQRKQLDKEVLNDHRVSASYGRHFEHPFKNRYEDKLSEFEDERHEMDMALECVKVTIELAEKLVMMISDKSIEIDGLFPVEEYFSGPSLRCIKVLYGDYGLNVIKELRTDVSLSLPRILSRLKQKKEEWRMFSSGFNKLWKPVFAVNHEMSLDHQDAYLEQQDSKFLSNNDLLAEINGINKLEFVYSDMDIHKDLYQLIEQSCSDICSSEQLDRAMKIWTSLVESMFGLLLRSAGCTDDSKHIAETRISNEQIMNYNAPITNEPEGTRGQEGTDGFLEFLTNEIDFSPIVDLEKGGFAAHMHNIEQNYDQEGVLGSEAVADNAVEETSSNDRENVDIVQEEDRSLIFYGDDAFYVFFRLHQALYGRLEEAKRLANDSYPVFLDLLHNYLTGAYKDKFENECRTIFGNSSGLIFLIERLINKLSRQLRAVTMNEVDNKLLDLYASEKTRESGRFVDEVYAANARSIVTTYKMFRFECLPIRETDGQTRLTIQQINKVKTRGKGKIYSRK